MWLSQPVRLTMIWQRILNGSVLVVSVVVATWAGWLAVRAGRDGRAAGALVNVLTTLFTLLLAYACADALRRGGAPRERLIIGVIALAAVGLCVQVFWL